jgi:hypothetical protein
VVLPRHLSEVLDTHGTHTRTQAMTCPDKNVRSSRLPGEASPLAGPSHGDGFRFRQAVCCTPLRSDNTLGRGLRPRAPLPPFMRPSRENDSAQKPRRWRRSAVSVSRAEFPADRTSPTPRLSGGGEAAILDQRSMRLGGSTRQKRRCTIDSGSTRRKNGDAAGGIAIFTDARACIARSGEGTPSS